MPELARPANFDWDTDISETERDALLETVVAAVRRWRLELPVTLFLEIHAPLSHLAGQGLVVFSPFLAAMLPGGVHDVQKCVKILEDPNNVRRLIDRINENEETNERITGEKRDAARG